MTAVTGRLVGRSGEWLHERHARHSLADLRAGGDGGAGSRPAVAAHRARSHQLELDLPHRPLFHTFPEVAGLCAGGADARLRRPAHHVHADPAQHDGTDPRHGDARHGLGGAFGSRALLSGPRHPAAVPELGLDADGCAPAHPARALGGHLPRSCHLPLGARLQPSRRWPARQSRPAYEDAHP